VLNLTPRGPNQTGDTLTLILGEALLGVDISTRYPRFYYRLLADSILRQDFLDGLELLEAEISGTSILLPESPSRDLAFLADLERIQAAVKQEEAHRWRIYWHYPRTRLQILLEPALYEVRSQVDLGESIPDEMCISLVDEQVLVGSTFVSALVEVYCLSQRPDTLRLAFFISTQGKVSSIQSTIRWGAYQETLAGELELITGVPFAAILDSTGRFVDCDFELVVEAVGV
jgi:hypothetical protein